MNWFSDCGTSKGDLVGNKTNIVQKLGALRVRNEEQSREVAAAVEIAVNIS
jgi:hypothetical protein